MIEIPPIDPDAVRWSADDAHESDRPLIVLLHGYAADEHDLMPLAEHLPDAFDYASVRAPLPPPFPTPGASWFPIEGLYGRDPEATTLATVRLIEWSDEHAEGRPIGFVGFSQGGVVALQALRLQPERFLFAVNLAGYAAPGPLATDELLAAVKPAVFWGRGADDTVIPAPMIAHTAQWLPDHVELSGRVYPNLGHSLSMEELADVRTFLEKRRDALASDE